MKKILVVVGDLLLYFLSVLLVGFVMDKLWEIDMPLWKFALFLTVGWGIWRCIRFLIKQVISKKSKLDNSIFAPEQKI